MEENTGFKSHSNEILPVELELMTRLRSQAPALVFESKGVAAARSISIINKYGAITTDPTVPLAFPSQTVTLSASVLLYISLLRITSFF